MQVVAPVVMGLRLDDGVLAFCTYSYEPLPSTRGTPGCLAPAHGQSRPTLAVARATIANAAVVKVSLCASGWPTPLRPSAYLTLLEETGRQQVRTTRLVPVRTPRPRRASLLDLPLSPAQVLGRWTSAGAAPDCVSPRSTTCERTYAPH